MHSVRWLGYTGSGNFEKTKVHFFPSSGRITAPYPARCRISLSGTGIPESKIVLEGARICQPDGVRLEEIFPVLADNIGLCAVLVEINTLKARVDLSGSKCIFEFASPSGSVKFNAHRLEKSRVYSLREEQEILKRRLEEDPWMGAVLGIKSRQTNTSLGIVNMSEDPWKPDFSFAEEEQISRVPGLAGMPAVPGGQVVELPLGEDFFSGVEETSMSAGDMKRQTVRVRRPVSQMVSMYVVYRDSSDNSLQSVSAL